MHMLFLSYHYMLPQRVGGVKVSMVAFQAADPGSIPGRRTFYV